MQTRRDLYQAHKLMMQRVGLALLQGEPDIAESPMRRLSVAAFSGAMLAILIGAIFGIVGLIHPGGARGLDAGDKILIEKETGTKYVYNTTTKQMQPALNYASAKLAVKADNPETRVVSRGSLSKYTRGPMIGIVGAPDSLPDPDHLVREPWSVCVHKGPNSAGGTQLITSLVAGTNVGGTPLKSNQALAVQDGGQAYVIWQSQRMRLNIQGNEVSNITRGIAPVPVSHSWLNPITEGADFAAPLIPHPGRPRKDIRADLRNGQVFKVQVGGAPTSYVLEDEGFAAISDTQAALLLTAPDTQRYAYHGQSVVARDIDPATVSSHPAPTLKNAQLPDKLPDFQHWDNSTPLCTVYPHTTDGSTDSQITTKGTLPSSGPAATTTSQTAVDQVLLPPGGAALVGLLPGPGQVNNINSWYIVNDAGISFPLSSKDTAKKLGYDIGKAAPIPKPVLQLIPTGPTLDPKLVKELPPPRATG